MKKNKNDFYERVGTYMKEIEKIAKRLKVSQSLCITFPRKKKTPFLSRIALWVVRKQGGVLDTQFQNLKQ
jgi:hypothetical protein